MTPKISLCYVTGRRQPHFSWFADSLCAQTTPEQRAEMEIIFVDGCLWHKDPSAYINHQTHVPFSRHPAPSLNPIHFPTYFDWDRITELWNIVGGRFQYLHIPPKPTAWQGPFRQTTRDFFCASNTRNTAMVVANAPYLVFVDDLSILMPGFFDQVRHAAQDQYVVCGAYKKVKQLKVVDGKVESFEHYEAGVDSRWNSGSDNGVVPWRGGGLYGCSFGVPLEAMLEIDGFDGVGNGGGYEDCDAGMRLERAGWQIFYNRNMLTLESEEDHHVENLQARFRKVVTRDRLPKNYDSYLVPNEVEKYWSDHVILNRLCNETDRILPLIGDNLRELRKHYQATGLVPVPVPNQLDWRDGAPLSSL